MSEREWADRFDHDQGRPLSSDDRIGTEPLPTGYRQALDLARTIATTDFSTESRVRQSLRRRLLDQVSARDEWNARKERTTHTHAYRRRSVAVLVAVLLLSLLGLAIVWPDAVSAAAQEIYNTIQRVVMGQYTDAVQVQFEERPSEPRELPSDMWVIHTDIGGFAGNAPPGVDPTVRSTADFEEAQAATDFHLRAPTYLQEGYALREVKLAPIGSTTWAFLFYGGPGHDIIIVQMPVGPQPSDEPNVAVGVKSGVITNGTLEEVDFDGRSAAWVDDHSLVWEEDVVSYTVGGLDLSLDEAFRIARSLK